MKKTYFERGFTLIELLVVIAIIGILSSVVLATLNQARNKGVDAAVKANLANTRAQAETFYDTGSTYEGVCALTGTNVYVIGPGVLAAAQATGATYGASDLANIDTTSTGGTAAVCHDAAGGWAAAAPMKNPASAGGAWCVDYTGAAKEVIETALDTDGDITCN